MFGFSISNFDFEWFGKVIFTAVMAAAYLAAFAGIVTASEKLFKKILRAILKEPQKKAAAYAQRERELRRAQYISMMNDSDYYGN